MNYSLSSVDISNVFNHKCTITLYADLKHMEAIDQLFGKYDVAFILYQTAPTYGHWVVLCKHKGHLYFFDPYGIFPDDELKYCYKPFGPWLSQLILGSNYTLSYNKYKLQNINKQDISTCGRWCCLYAYCFDDTSFKQFAQIFDGFDADECITFLTGFLESGL
jgi:hypothetical protein